jgi:hypothetical protein
MRIPIPTATLLAPLVLTLAACGGGDPEPDAERHGAASAEAATDGATALAVRRTVSTTTTSQRAAAAAATAQSSVNACAVVRPFYWEVGTRDGAAGSGTVGGNRVTANTPLHYASASKWLYSAYVAQRRGGVLTHTDVQMLTLRSGYTSFVGCQPGQTLDACLASGSNGRYSASTDGRFSYNGGHMQKHASINGLGAMTPAGLATALKSQLGSDMVIGFSQAQPAGGAYGTPKAYAGFLRKLLGGQLRLGAMLGSSSVCANPKTCASGEALASPLPAEDRWRYSLGHWVEADPETGDGAFSSAGAFGFYPWIDANRSSYGIVARVAPSGAGVASAACGRLIRQAFASGVAL